MKKNIFLKVFSAFLVFSLFSACTFISERDSDSSAPRGSLPVTIDLAALSQAISSARFLADETTSYSLYCNALLTGVTDKTYSSSQEISFSSASSESQIQLNFTDIPSDKAYKISIGIFSESSRKGLEFATGSSEEFTVVEDKTQNVNIKISINTDLNGNYYVAQGCNGNGTFLDPASFESAILKINSSLEGSVKILLLSDVSCSTATVLLPENIDFTLDLGGHTLTYTSTPYDEIEDDALDGGEPTIVKYKLILNSINSNVTIKNGTIKSDSSLNWWDGNGDSPFIFKKDDDALSKKLSVNISDLTLSSFNYNNGSSEESGEGNGIIKIQGPDYAEISSVTLDNCSGYTFGLFATSDNGVMSDVRLSGSNNFAKCPLSVFANLILAKDFTINSNSSIELNIYECENNTYNSLITLESALSESVYVSPYFIDTSTYAPQSIFSENSVIDAEHILLTDAITSGGYYLSSRGKILPEQELAYRYYDSGNSYDYEMGIKYGASDAYTRLGTSSSMDTCIDDNGQIYVLSDDNSIYKAGTSYSLADNSADSSKFYLVPLYNSPDDDILICKYDMENSYLIFFKVAFSDSEQTYSLVESGFGTISLPTGEAETGIRIGSSYTATGSDNSSTLKMAACYNNGSVDLYCAQSVKNPLGPISIDGETYSQYEQIIELYKYTNNIFSSYGPERLTGSQVFGKENVPFRSNVKITVLPATSRGSMLEINPDSLTITNTYGKTSQNLHALFAGSSSPTGAFCGPYLIDDSDYSTLKTFVAPQRFIAIKPKKITIADYGMRAVSLGDGSSGEYASAGTVNGKAVFSLSSSSLSFSDLENARYEGSGAIYASALYVETSYSGNFTVQTATGY